MWCCTVDKVTLFSLDTLILRSPLAEETKAQITAVKWNLPINGKI
jgi:hypothetical protein